MDLSSRAFFSFSFQVQPNAIVEAVDHFLIRVRFNFAGTADCRRRKVGIQSRERAIDGPRRPPRVATAYLYKLEDPSSEDHSLIATAPPYSATSVIIVCAKLFGSRDKSSSSFGSPIPFRVHTVLCTIDRIHIK